MTGFTASNVLAYAEVVGAIQGRSRVLVEVADRRIEGTLRAITSSEDSSGFLPHNGDLRQAWVWITTTGGFETWVKLSDLVQARTEGSARFS